MAYGKHIEIGELRWPVYLSSRVQVAQTDGTGIDETAANTLQVYASIEPVGMMAFINSSVIGPADTITHRIYLRFIDGIDMFKTIVRQLQREDGTTRMETFRILRSSEVEGRQRFLALDVRLETKLG